MANSPSFPSTFFTTGFDSTSDRVTQKFKELHGDTDFIKALMVSWDYWSETTITAAQMLALNTTPITVVAAPPSGYLIYPTAVFASLNYNSTTYSCNASGASIFYKSDATGQNTGLTLTQAFIQSTSSKSTLVRGSSTQVVDTTANLSGQPLALLAASSNPTTGDGVLKVLVFYNVLPVPLP